MELIGYIRRPAPGVKEKSEGASGTGGFPRPLPIPRPGGESAPKATEEVLAQLESWGSETGRRVAAKNGAPEPQFGAPMGKLRGFARKLETDHALALWATGNADAMLLGTMIMAKDRLSEREIEGMVRPLAQRFARIGEGDVADLDAVRPSGSRRPSPDGSERGSARRIASRPLFPLL